MLLTSDLHKGLDIRGVAKGFHRFLDCIPDFDVMVLAGDIGNNSRRHLRSALESIRKKFPDKPILFVMGNHDLWDKGTRDLSFLLKKHREQFQKFNIHYLSEMGEFVLGDTVFFGFDGWYAQSTDDTNDGYWINSFQFDERLQKPVRFDEWLRWRERFQIDEAITIAEKHPQKKNKILITHFPISHNCLSAAPWSSNLNYFNYFFKDKITHYLYGHTHQRILNQFDNCITLNSGSGYHHKSSGITYDPAYALLEIEDNKNSITFGGLNQEVQQTVIYQHHQYQ